MTTAESTSKQSLSQFIKNNECDHYCVELLRFFGAHPNARFSKLAVVHALSENGSKLYIEKSLRYLNDKGIVRVYTEDKVYFYALADDEPVHKMVSDLGKLDWRQWQLVLQCI